MKPLIVFYSKSGNNKFLAEKCAQTLHSDIEEIVPRLNVFPVMAFSSLIKMGLGIKTLKHTVAEYDTIILFGPVWMGQLIYPLRAFINKYNTNIERLFFGTSCSSSDAEKNSRFGYETVFSQIRSLAGNRCLYCEAFPIDLVLSEEKKEDSTAIMKTRLSDELFSGEIADRFNQFIKKIKD